MNSLSGLIQRKQATIDIFGFDEELPTPETLPCAYIINSGNVSDAKYAHWFAVFIDKSRDVYYFDSFGIILDPVYKKIKKWGDGFGEVVYNKRIIQSFDSFTCGAYCVCFVYFMTYNKTFQEFLSIFTSDLLNNDNLAINLLDKISCYG